MPEIVHNLLHFDTLNETSLPSGELSQDACQLRRSPSSDQHSAMQIGPLSSSICFINFGLSPPGAAWPLSSMQRSRRLASDQPLLHLPPWNVLWHLRYWACCFA